METYSFTLTPHNKNPLYIENKGSILAQQNAINQFFVDYEVIVFEIAFEQCKKGQSKRKIHAHGVIQCPEFRVEFLKEQIIKRFGHNGSERCIQIIPLHHPERWAQYIRKDKNLFI